MKIHSIYTHLQRWAGEKLIPLGFEKFGEQYFKISPRSIIGFIKTTPDPKADDYYLVFTHKAMGYYFPDPEYSISAAISTYPVSIKVADFELALGSTHSLFHSCYTFFGPKRVMEEQKELPASFRFKDHSQTELEEELPIALLQKVFDVFELHYQAIEVQLTPDLCYRALKDCNPGESILAEDMLHQMIAYYKFNQLKPPALPKKQLQSTPKWWNHKAM